MPITVSIVEDNEQLRSTLARVVGRAEGFRCVSHYGTAEAALEGLPKDGPQVVLMDIHLPGMDGVECVRQLKPRLPATQVLMLTVYEDTDTIFNALAAGAAGYLLKRTKSAELLEAIAHDAIDPLTTFGNDLVSSITVGYMLHAFVGRADRVADRAVIGSLRGDRAIIDTNVLVQLLGVPEQREPLQCPRP